MSDKNVVELEMSNNILTKEIKDKESHLLSINLQIKKAKDDLEKILRDIDVKKEMKIAVNVKEFNKLSNDLDIREELIINREKTLKEQSILIAQREKDIVDYEKIKVDIDNKRADFILYKNNIEKELTKVNEEITEKKEILNSLSSRKQELEGLEKSWQLKKDWLADQVASLENDKKAFEIEKSNFNSLKIGGKNG